MALFKKESLFAFRITWPWIQGIRKHSGGLQKSKWLAGESCKFAFKARLDLLFLESSAVYYLSYIKTSVEVLSDNWRSTSSEDLLLYFLLILIISSIVLQKEERTPLMKWCALGRLGPTDKTEMGKWWNWSYKFLFFSFTLVLYET